MARGVGRWRQTCSGCGNVYTLTNFMYRYAVDDQGRYFKTNTPRGQMPRVENPDPVRHATPGPPEPYYVGCAPAPNTAVTESPAGPSYQRIPEHRAVGATGH